YAAEDCSVSSRDLFRYQPKPRAEVAALRKRVSRSDCGHHRTRDDWPNAGYAHQPLAAFILPRQRFDLAGYALDALIQPAPITGQVLDHPQHARRQDIAGRGENAR